jgi:hypothetical protein
MSVTLPLAQSHGYSYNCNTHRFNIQHCLTYLLLPPIVHDRPGKPAAQAPYLTTALLGVSNLVH